MPTERIQLLVQRFFDHVVTPSEMEELAVWIVDSNTEDSQLKEILQTAWYQHSPSSEMPKDMTKRILTSIFKSDKH